MAATLAQSLRSDIVANLRLRPVCRVAPGDSVDHVISAMTKQRTGCALVMEGAQQGQIVGIFTERDFLSRVVGPRLDTKMAVRNVMTPAPVTIAIQAPVLSAIEIMQEGGYRHLPVLGDDGQPAGVLSVKDIIHYLVEYFPARVYNLPPTPQQQGQPSREGA